MPVCGTNNTGCRVIRFSAQHGLRPGQVNRVVESTLRQIPPQIRHLEARKAIEMNLGPQKLEIYGNIYIYGNMLSRYVSSEPKPKFLVPSGMASHTLHPHMVQPS